MSSFAIRCRPIRKVDGGSDYRRIRSLLATAPREPLFRDTIPWGGSNDERMLQGFCSLGAFHPDHPPLMALVAHLARRCRNRVTWNFLIGLAGFLMAAFEIVTADLSNAAHQDAVLAMLDAFSDDPMGDQQPSSDFVRAHLVEGLRDHPTTLVFLAMHGDQSIGIAVCFRGFSTFAAKPLINVHDFYVDVNLRGRGIGRLLSAEDPMGLSSPASTCHRSAIPGAISAIPEPDTLGPAGRHILCRWCQPPVFYTPHPPRPGWPTHLNCVDPPGLEVDV